MDLKNKTMKAVKWNFVATAVGAAAGLVQVWALSHILAPHEYGVISLALLIVSFLTIFIDFGISNSIVRQQEITEIELSSLYRIAVLLGVVIFLIAYFSAPWIALFFNSTELTLQIRIMSFVFLLAPFAQQQRAIFVRELRFEVIAIITIITMVVNFVVVLSLAYLYRKAWAASVAFLVSTGVSSVIFFMLGLRERKLSFAWQWSAARPHIRYGVQLVSDSLINVVSVNTYPALMARLVSLSAIGGYNIANSISINLIDKLKPVLTQALFPAFAKIQHDDSRLSNNFLMVTTYGALINFPMLMGMIITSTAIVGLFFSAEWQFVDGLVTILCLVGMFRSIDSPVISLLLVRAKMYLNVRMGIAKLVIGIPLAYFLGKRYGIEGIVLSFLIVQGSNTILGYFFLVRPCIAGIGKPYAKAVLIPVLQLLPMIVVSGLLTRFPVTGIAALNLAIVIVAGGLAYVLGLYFSPFSVVRDFFYLGSRSISPKLEKLLIKKLAGKP